MTQKVKQKTNQKTQAKKRKLKPVKVRGLVAKGAWHSDGKIPYGEEVLISAIDAKSLITLNHVEKVK